MRLTNLVCSDILLGEYCIGRIGEWPNSRLNFRIKLEYSGGLKKWQSVGIETQTMTLSTIDRAYRSSHKATSLWRQFFDKNN